MGDKHNKGKAAGEFKKQKPLSDYKRAQAGQNQGVINPADRIGMNSHHKK